MSPLIAEVVEMKDCEGRPRESGGELCLHYFVRADAAASSPKAVGDRWPEQHRRGPSILHLLCFGHLDLLCQFISSPTPHSFYPSLSLQHVCFPSVEAAASAASLSHPRLWQRPT